jgi:hypothetical protein
MAIGFRSVGARLKTDVTTSGGLQSVSLPAGHAAGDLLLLFVVTDGNSSCNNPPGWTRIAYGTTGTSTQNPYTPLLQIKIFWRIDTGSMGSNVTLLFNTSTWPAGDPYVLAFTAAYTGCDPASPVETISMLATGNATASHPQVTTTAAGDWLLTYRCSSTDAPAATYTESVGTDVERVDDSDGFNELSCALYDSNAALTAGTQTQRATTASRAITYSSVMVSIAIKPTAAGATSAAPGTAEAAATAYGPTVQSQDGPWALCGTDLPDYQVAVDWSGDGVFRSSTATGAVYASDTFGRTVSNGWGTADTGQAWSNTGGSVSDYSVGSGSGLHSVASRGASRYTTLAAPAADTDTRVSFSTSQVAAGDSFLVNVLARWTGTSDFYSARVELDTAQGVTLSLRASTSAGGDSALGSFTTSLTHSAGTSYTVRLRILGTTLWAKIWPAASPEPDWQLTADSSAITAAGSVGVRSMARSATTNTLPVVFSYTGLTVLQAADADDVTPDIVSDISVTYGRDQERQLAPAAVGSASFSLNNTERTYSPENTASPLYGNLDPARAMRAQVVWSGQTYPLFRGKVDDYTVKADYGDRTVDLSFLDGMNDLSGKILSTAVYASMRTGALVNQVLDEAGWTGGRDIDSGATVVKYWWADGTDALSAINDLVKSEGPPSVAYVAPDGTFVFRDRHHRMLRQASQTDQATFHAGELGECTGQGVPQGMLSLARPFTYSHGWRDIVNTVAFDVADRAPSADLSQVWQDTTTYVLSLGQSLDLTVSSSDPFMSAVTPVVGTDILASGAGVLSVLLSRDSGASARLTLQAIGGPVTVTSVQVRAQLLSVQQTIRVSMQDPGSVTRHGERSYPNDAPWAGAQDAQAIANMVLLHYAERRPTVQIRLVSSDPAHLVQVLSRTISDRVRIVNEEMRLDDDFFVERVTHTVQRTGTTGRPPVHAVVLGCEKDLDSVVNPFTFDKRGAGFDQGVFDPLQSDDASQVFIFDDPVQGQFNTGEFGT